MKPFILWILLLASSTAQAAPWEFGPVLAVSGKAAEGVYTHLESAGRKSIAVSAGWVAVAWEDNRDGWSRGYIAMKEPGQHAFGKAMQVSGKGEVTEPAIIGIGGGRFAVGWEEEGHVWVRVVSAAEQGPALMIAPGEAAQVSLAFDAKAGLQAVWAQHAAPFWQIRFARLQVLQGNALKPGKPLLVEGGAKGDQAYPSLAILDAGNLVAGWEDRSKGHTRMITAVSRNGGASFLPSCELNEYKWRGKDFNYGMGTGAMRIALSSMGRGGAVAVWADKRDFPSGYDVYAALADAKSLIFGKNEKVQDEFGNNIAQWHPAIAADGHGHIASVWDDDRDGTPDVWLSWRNADGSWADNLAVPGAAGEGVQSDPAIAMDEAGNLHLAWVEKSGLNAPSSIKYVFGRLQK